MKYFGIILRRYKQLFPIGVLACVITYVALLNHGDYQDQHQTQSITRIPRKQNHGPRRPTRLGDRKVEKRFAARHEILRQGCKGNRESPGLKHPTKGYLPFPLFPPVINVSIGYCGIPKTASTTWKEIFKALGEEMKRRGIPGVEDSDTKHKNVTFVFVREPYARLLSGYMDKFFSPNRPFWRLGRYIVEKFRDNPSERSLRCGHDVTFAEFIKYFIHSQTTGVRKDVHFEPTHEHCGVCRLPYMYIGHLETLDEDMPFILKRMQSPLTFSQLYSNLTLEDNVELVLSTNKMRYFIETCMTLNEACRRLWKKWQVRGIISKHQFFPLSEVETRNISAESFLHVARLALSESGSYWEILNSHEQKRGALREAFSLVPASDAKRVRELLSLDFELFGYDPSPVEVFPEKPYANDDNFSFFSW